MTGWARIPISASKLRALYGAVQDEAIPDRLLDLLEKLDEAEQTEQADDPEPQLSATHATAEPPSFKRELLATLPSLRAFAVSLSGKHDKADDLVQDTMMKAWAKQDSFELGTNIKAWLFTILRNEFYSQMRKRGREVQDTDGAFTERLAVHPSQYGVAGSRGFPEGARQAAGRSARGDHPDRRVGLFL